MPEQEPLPAIFRRRNHQHRVIGRHHRQPAIRQPPDIRPPHRERPIHGQRQEIRLQAVQIRHEKRFKPAQPFRVRQLMRQPDHRVQENRVQFTAFQCAAEDVGHPRDITDPEPGLCRNHALQGGGIGQIGIGLPDGIPKVPRGHIGEKVPDPLLRPHSPRRPDHILGHFGGTVQHGIELSQHKGDPGEVTGFRRE